MLVKDMYLKNKKYLFSLLTIICILLSYKTYSNTDDKDKVLSYLNSLKYFSASFLQRDEGVISEGKIYIGEERVRAEYFSPGKILIILDADKAMYYNYDLEEDEFFNPQNTNAWFFYEIFRNPLFFQDGLVKIENNEMLLQKEGVNNEEQNFRITALFEKNPLVLRGIEVKINEDVLKFSVYNHSYNEDFDKDFFKLINPKFLN